MQRVKAETIIAKLLQIISPPISGGAGGGLFSPPISGGAGGGPFFFFLLFSLSSLAQDTLIVSPRLQTTHVNLFGAGWANTYDTYLSPLEYNGWNIAYQHETMRQTHWRNITTQGKWRIHASRTKNRAQNHSAWGARLSYQHAWHYNWQVNRFSLRAGLGIKGDIGGLYVSHGGNNPAQGYASLALIASVAAECPFTLFNRPFCLSTQLDAPWLGMMFSPNYLQPYYDIFTKGHYSHNIVCSWQGNCPTLHGQLMLDIPVCSQTLRLGYAFDFIQSTPNHLRQHTYLHTFMLGYVKRFAIIKRK